MYNPVSKFLIKCVPYYDSVATCSPLMKFEVRRIMVEYLLPHINLIKGALYEEISSFNSCHLIFVVLKNGWVLK